MTTTPTPWLGPLTLSGDWNTVLAAADGGFFVVRSVFDGAVSIGDDFSVSILKYDARGNLLSTSADVTMADAASVAGAVSENGNVILGLIRDGVVSADPATVSFTPQSGFSAPGTPLYLNPASTDHVLTDVATGTSGNVAVVYTEEFASEVEVRLAITTAAGTVLFDNYFAVNATGIQEQTKLATLSNGDFVAVWLNAQASEIKFRTISSDGSTLSSEFLAGGGVGPSSPEIAVLTNGNIVIAWQETGEDRINHRVFTPQGTPVTVVQSLTVSGGADAKIIALKDGGYVIAYETDFGTEAGDGSPDTDIGFRRFDASGTPIGIEGRIDLAGDQAIQSIDVLADGRFVISYATETGDATNVFKQELRIFDPRENVIQGTGGNDQIIGRTDASTVLGLAGNDTLYGYGGDDTLLGGDGNDFLIGQGGADSLIGGRGHDRYFIDSADSVVEGVAGGTDTIISSQGSIDLENYTNVENVVLQGGLAINAIGSAAANTLNGSVNANANILIGLDGNDTYIVSIRDSVIESEGPDSGIDTVKSSSRSLNLASTFLNVENATLLGAENLSAIGNGQANVLIGNSGRNTLTGAAGRDTLSGGGGDDTLSGGLGIDFLVGGTGRDSFLFNTILSANANVDTITGFVSADDTIKLDNAVFTAFASVAEGSVIAAAAFKANASGIATDANDRIVYNTTTGALSYDTNGNAAGGATQFASLAGHPTLTYSDFVIV